MRCFSCRATIRATWRYCPQCGQPAAGQTEASAGGGAPEMVETQPLEAAELLDLLPHGVLFINASGRIVHLNKAARPILGVRSQENVVGRPFREIVRSPKFLKVVWRALVEKRPAVDMELPCPEEFCIQKKKRTVFYQVYITQQNDADGNLLGTAFVFERPLDLQELTEAKKEFVSTIDRELGRPLGIIRSMAGNLLDETERDEPYGEEARREFCNVLIRAADYIQGLVKEMPTYPRSLRTYEIGVEMNWEANVGLRKLAEEVVEVHRGRTDRHTFVLDFVPEEIEIETDPDKFQNILQNFVSNAIKFSPDGGEIRVMARLRPPDDLFLFDSVVVGVQDHGIGIAAKDLGKLGQKFYRVESTGERRYRVIGIGLYLVKALIVAHEGTMKVESEPGQGSTFWVRLPVRQPFEIEDEPSAGRQSVHSIYGRLHDRYWLIDG